MSNFKVTKDAVVTAIKQFFRAALGGAVAVVAQTLSSGGHLDLKTVAVAAGVALLLAVDKYIHEEPNIPINGISPV